MATYTDQQIRDKGFLYIPKQEYLQKPFEIPIAPVPPVVNEGIVNTNAFVNSGGGGEIRYDNSFLPDPPNIPITGGFDGGYGADPISGDLPGGGNIVDEFGIDGDVYAGTGINNIGPSGNLPGGGNLYDEFQKDGKDYSQGAFEETEEDDKKNFISNMISRAKQIGSDLPAWAKAAATAIGGPLSVAANLIGIGTSNTSPSYQQFSPGGTFKGGIYSIDGVNYGNMSMVNDFYDSNEDSDTYGTNRFDRAKEGSFASFRTLKDYFDSKKNNDGDGDDDKDKDKDTPGFSAPTQQGQSPKGSTTGGNGEGGTGGTGGTGGVGGANDGNPGANTSNQGHSQHFARGGRAGYFFGGRVNYKIGGRVNFKYGGLASIL